MHVYPTRADLPILIRSTLRTLAAQKADAVGEAKQSIDRILLRLGKTEVGDCGRGLLASFVCQPMSEGMCRYAHDAKNQNASELATERSRMRSLGSLEDTISKLKAEAAYFVAEHGMRCAMIFFDMKDSADIPVIAEPLFIGLCAELGLVPVI